VRQCVEPVHIINFFIHCQQPVWLQRLSKTSTGAHHQGQSLKHLLAISRFPGPDGNLKYARTRIAVHADMRPAVTRT
jgi:hypothetical protein